MRSAVRAQVSGCGQGRGSGGVGVGAQRRSHAGVGLCALHDFKARAGPGQEFWGGWVG